MFFWMESLCRSFLLIQKFLKVLFVVLFFPLHDIVIPHSSSWWYLLSTLKIIVGFVICSNGFLDRLLNSNLTLIWNTDIVMKYVKLMLEQFNLFHLTVWTSINLGNIDIKNEYRMDYSELAKWGEWFLFFTLGQVSLFPGCMIFVTIPIYTMQLGRNIEMQICSK